MKIVDLIVRIALYVVAVLSAIIALDAVLLFFDAEPENAIVSFVRDTAEWLRPDELATMFAEQTEIQTAVLTLLAYGLLALLIVLVGRALRFVLTAIKQATGGDAPATGQQAAGGDASATDQQAAAGGAQQAGSGPTAAGAGNGEGTGDGRLLKDMTEEERDALRDAKRKSSTTRTEDASTE